MKNEPEIDLYEIFPRLNLAWTEEDAAGLKGGRGMVEKYAVDMSSMDDRKELNNVING